MVRTNRILTVCLVCVVTLCMSCATKPPGQSAKPIPEPAQGSKATSAAQTGTVQCMAPGMAEVLTDKGVLRFDKDGKLQLAPGAYSVMAYSLRTKHTDGAEWRIVGQSTTAGVPLTVKAGETCTLKFGPPITSKLFARKLSANEYSFSVKLTGQGGEVYSPRDITRSGQMPPAPKVEIRSASDASKVIASGGFKYG